MPVYDYQCENCGNRFVETQKIKDMYEPESKPCPHCQQMFVKKKIFSGVIFNPDVVKPDQKFVEHMREMKRTIYKNNLPDY